MYHRNEKETPYEDMVAVTNYKLPQVMNESLPSYNKHQLLVGAVCWKYQTFASCKQRLVRARATTL